MMKVGELWVENSTGSVSRITSIFPDELGNNAVWYKLIKTGDYEMCLPRLTFMARHYKQGVYVSDDGDATRYYLDGNLHREDGPAIQFQDNGYEYYYLYGVSYKKELWEITIRPYIFPIKTNRLEAIND